jgi:hypothetical protein
LWLSSQTKAALGKSGFLLKTFKPLTYSFFKRGVVFSNTFIFSRWMVGDVFLDSKKKLRAILGYFENFPLALKRKKWPQTEPL